MNRRRLVALALRQHAEPDEEFTPGFNIWFGRRIGREYGPYLPAVWRWALTLKCIACVLLGRADSDSFDWGVVRGHVTIAEWDFERHNGYPENDYGEWNYLKVRYGWRPRSWRYDAGRDSTG